MQTSIASVISYRSTEFSEDSKEEKEEGRRSFSSVSTLVMRSSNNRSSTRKSINGLVIEFDWEDKQDAALWGKCEDYKHNTHQVVRGCTPSTQMEHQENEFRAKLEAVEIEEKTYSSSLNAYDVQHCIRKQLMEALEHSKAASPIFEEETNNNSIVVSPVEDICRRPSIRKSFNGLVIEYGDCLFPESDNDSVWSEDVQ